MLITGGRARRRHSVNPTRRDVIRAGAGVAVGAAGAGALAAGLPSPPRPYRVAHLTDMHVQPERRAGEGYAAALASLETLAPRADLIVTGGDHVMDATDEGVDRARAQWEVYQRAIASTKTPVKAVLGNHDILGWGVREMMPATTPGYGRAMALDQLKMAEPYYSFDAGGWHFVMLDSMTRRGFSYTAY